MILAFRDETWVAPIRDELSLVAVGRTLLVDPEWLLKLRDGRNEDITAFTPEALSVLQ